MDFLLSDGSWLFSVALIIVASIGALELVTLLVGGSLSSMIDGMVGEMPEAGGLAWLHVGRLPFLVVVVLLLTAFAVLGLGLQGVAAAFFDQQMPALAAVPLALLGALPATRAAGSALARVMPRDESSAISSASFVGRTAIMLSGEAKQGRAAEARFQDEYGQTHYVMVEPEAKTATLRAGERVLLLRELRSGRYQAAVNTIAE